MQRPAEVPKETPSELRELEHEVQVQEGEQARVQHLPLVELRELPREGGTLLDPLEEVQEPPQPGWAVLLLSLGLEERVEPVCEWF